MITKQDIEAGKSPKGGFTKAQLAKWGVAWPPVSGWQDALIEGRNPNIRPGATEPQEKTAHDLLAALCVTLINRNMANIIHGVPGLVEYFGGRFPSEDEIAASKATLKHDKGDDLPWD